MKTLYLSLSHNREVPFYIGQQAKDHFPMLDRSKPSDLWFHLDDYPSCHIIASVPEHASREDIKKLIRHGIRLSKEHSKYGTNVKVIHARVRNVSKTTSEGKVNVLK
jgi:predicted ribosome quality control (RQC) complex YloA/Tae2 family protein